MSNLSRKPMILIICDYYLPGFESGGAMRTIVNMTDRLGDEFDFKIITRDHDGPLNRTPYRGVRVGEWNAVGNADVYYLDASDVHMSSLRRLVKETAPAAIYVNSFFSPLTIFVLMLRRLKRIRATPVILAPEGEFSPGALSLKSVKKKLYIRAAKLLHLLKGVVWKAGSEPERRDIENVIGKRLDILVAPNMPPVMINEPYSQADKPEKAVGSANMVFLSRFMRKKNFNWLLRHLLEINGELSIDICGPVEDADYWIETQEIIKTLPPNIAIALKGPVPHDQVAATLMKYHFFILPTLGENFGHVFIEALAAGCPLVISNRTPWRDLEEKAIGWDLPLEDPDEWLATIEKCIQMPHPEFTNLSQHSRQFAKEWLTDPDLEESNRNVIRAALR